MTPAMEKQSSTALDAPSSAAVVTSFSRPVARPKMMETKTMPAQMMLIAISSDLPKQSVFVGKGYKFRSDVQM
jgi:hypothetical protein